MPISLPIRVSLFVHPAARRCNVVMGSNVPQLAGFSDATVNHSTPDYTGSKQRLHVMK